MVVEMESVPLFQGEIFGKRNILYFLIEAAGKSGSTRRYEIGMSQEHISCSDDFVPALYVLFTPWKFSSIHRSPVETKAEQKKAFLPPPSTALQSVLTGETWS